MVFANTYTGELPLEIIRMKANAVGVFVGLDGNMGFTLPSNIGELGDDITELDLSNCSLTGPRSTRTERPSIFADFIIDFYNVPRFQVASQKNSRAWPTLRS